jgi:Zn-dependent M28 family amino/carboxypeptidase
VPNVLCSLPGTSDKIIIIGAHFDRAPEGDGVVDNWSGASLLPSLYEALKGEARTHTYLFIGFTDAERGLVGSRDFVNQMSPSEVTATEAMINLETLGLGSTQIWLSHSDKRLADVLLYTANQLHLPVAGVNVERIGASSDSEEFAKRKIPRITIHSFTQEAFASRTIHSSKDKLSAMHLDDYYQTYRLVAAYAAVLDNSLRPSVSPGTK